MKKVLGLALVFSIFLSVHTAEAFGPSAWEHRTSPRGHSDREVPTHYRPAPHYERRLPAGCRLLRIANKNLYFLNGIYYRWTPFGYEVVTAPAGAIVGTLPPGYGQIFYGGTLYYVYNNTYYVRGPLGYHLVTPPQAVLCPARTLW